MKGGSIVNMRLLKEGRALSFSKARMLYSPLESSLTVSRRELEVERGLEQLNVARLSSRPPLMVD
jgi:hypothetical protein